MLLGSALAMTRKKRLEMIQRINQFNEDATGKSTAILNVANSNAQEKQLIVQIERLLLLQSDHPWKTHTSSAKLMIVAMAAGTGVWFVCHRFFGLPILFTAPLVMLAAFLMARRTLAGERRRIEEAFTAQFPEALDTAARMLRSGLPITSAMQTIGKEGPAPVNEVFGALSDQLKIGISLGDALKMSSKQIGLPDFRFFTVAVVVEQSAGGNLASTLDVLSEIMRKRRAIRLKAQAVTAEIRFSAYVLGALPFFTTGALLLIQPDYLAPLFSDPRGHVILGIVVGGLTLSILTMRHMMRSISSV